MTPYTYNEYVESAHTKKERKKKFLFLVAVTDNHILQDIPGDVTESYRDGTRTCA